MIFFLTWPSYTAFRNTDVPLFVNRNALFGSRGPKTLPKARGIWALDSGGFMELKRHGRWTITPEQYVKEVRRAAREIGNLEWAAQMDWMCEDLILAKTGKSVTEHQHLTIDNYVRLVELAPDLAHLFVPVLQGRDPEDYLTHFAMWGARGIDLRQANMVGVGSVCRRWIGQELADIFERLRAYGLRRLHAFGAKEESFARTGAFQRLLAPGDLFYDQLFHRALEHGLEAEWLLHPLTGVTWEETEVSTCRFMASADSNAWSTRARNQALEVWLARQEHAVTLGHPAELVGGDIRKRTHYCRDAKGVVYYGDQPIGKVLVERAGTRVEGYPVEVAAMFPTQIMVECARNATAGVKGKSHAECNQCGIWALEYRRRLKAIVEPHGCWEERVSFKKLPPVDFKAVQGRQFEHAAEVADRWERGELDEQLPGAREWRTRAQELSRRLEGLRGRVQELRARMERGEDVLLELHAARLELASAEGRLELPPED